MAASLVNSLFGSPSALVMLFLFCGKALTDFNKDVYGNILWEEQPADTAEQEYSTEGRMVFAIFLFGTSTCFRTSHSIIQSH